MARLILTNNKKKYQKAIERNVEAGFSDYSQYNNGEIFLSTHKKRIIKTDNYMEFPGGDFVAIVGTCIYNNHFGMEALKGIYNDFVGDVENIRVKAIGNYLVAIKKDEKVIIFVDKYQTLKTYYYSISGEWFITNSLADIGAVLDDKTINEFAFMQETMQIGVLGTQSIFENAYQLYGNQFIQIESNKLIVKDIPYQRKHWNLESRSIQSIVDEYVEMIKFRFAPVVSIFGDNIRIHQTGGLDNRTIFAAFMNAGCKPKIMYGVGNSLITNTKHEDLAATEMYANKFNLDFYQLDWKYDYINGFKQWQPLFDRYGFPYKIYGGNKPFFEEYEGKIPDYPRFMECGYFGENLRLREWALKHNKSMFTLNEFIDGYQLGGAYGDFITNEYIYPNASRFRDHIKRLFVEYSKIYGIEIDNGISINQFDEFRHIQSRVADSMKVNLLNDFAPSIAMLSIYDLHEFPFDIPAVFRANAKFQLMLIHKLYPEVLEIPVFTHCRKHDFNPKTFSLTPQYSLSSQSQFIAEYLRKSGINDKTYNMLRRIYHVLSFNKNNNNAIESEILKKHLVEIINEDAKHTELTFICPEKFNGDIRMLMIYAQYLHGVRLLNENG